MTATRRMHNPLISPGVGHEVWCLEFYLGDVSYYGLPPERLPFQTRRLLIYVACV